MKPGLCERSKTLTIVITAGPTREKIDPIRFISNYSTGRFGYELAREAIARGCKVVLVSGPTSLEAAKGVRVIRVESALEMRRAVLGATKRADCLIMNAAVSDWRVAKPSKRKLKKRPGKMVIELVENPDIVREAGKRNKDMVVVGFALETDNLSRNALKKLKEKDLDLIVANRYSSGSGVFGDRRIDVLMLDRLGNRSILPHKTKEELAKIVLDKVSSYNI